MVGGGGKSWGYHRVVVNPQHGVRALDKPMGLSRLRDGWEGRPTRHLLGPLRTYQGDTVYMNVFLAGIQLRIPPVYFSMYALICIKTVHTNWDSVHKI